MMCVQEGRERRRERGREGEGDGGRERERGVMMCGYEKTQFPIRCIIHVHVQVYTYNSPCTQITA